MLQTWTNLIARRIATPLRTMVNLTAIAQKNVEAEKTLEEVKQEVSKPRYPDQ